MRHVLSGLIFGCPYQKEREDCPLSSIRLTPDIERWHWLNDLEDTEVDTLAFLHAQCSLSRANE
jgi:hypothetical protein